MLKILSVKEEKMRNIDNCEHCGIKFYVKLPLRIVKIPKYKSDEWGVICLNCKALLMRERKFGTGCLFDNHKNSST